MTTDLKGKTAVVTGGSRGIGAAITRQFAAMGADVAILYAGNQQAAEAICEACQTEYGVRAKAYRCDVSNFEDTKKTMTEIKKDFADVHILVNNAGITKDALTPMMKEEDFDAVLDTNLKGAFNMIRHTCGVFIRKKEANYAAAKAGLIGLTKTVAKELAPKGVRCNAIAPGFIATDMTEKQGENKLLAFVPLGRMGQPEEIAQAAAYLATASYVTGEVLRVDGGLAM